jgi:hypothetical protein
MVVGVGAGAACASAGCEAGAACDVTGAAGCADVLESTGCCAAALKDVSSAAVTIQFDVRITLFSTFNTRIRFSLLLNHKIDFAKTL